jgi:hypothetical protein
MTNPLKRGSAPDRGRPDYLRPGTFKPRHAKHGGRQRGTPNKFSAEYKKHLLEAAYRVGWDGNGLLGVAGYLAWVSRNSPEIFAKMLGSLMEWQELEIGMPEKQRPTIQEHDERVRACISMSAQPKRSTSKLRSQKQTPPDPASPWAWTGKDTPVGPLMHQAVTDPTKFCTLLQAAFLPPPNRRQRERAALLREIAAGRAWRERLHAEQRRRAEERVPKKEETERRVEENSGGDDK